jgi:hypothetical protein
MEATLSRSKKCVTLQKKAEQTLIERGRNHGKTAGRDCTPHVLSPVKTLKRGTETADRDSQFSTESNAKGASREYACLVSLKKDAMHH